MAGKSSGGGGYRSAKSGRYVTNAHGKSHPKTTVKEAPGKSGPTGGSYRSAISGRIVTETHGKANPNTVSNENKPADCTITVALDTFKKMVARELDGTTAFMQGKLKVAGDMSVAMKLGPILAKAAG